MSALKILYHKHAHKISSKLIELRNFVTNSAFLLKAAENFSIFLNSQTHYWVHIKSLQFCVSILSVCFIINRKHSRFLATYKNWKFKANTKNTENIHKTPVSSHNGRLILVYEILESYNTSIKIFKF